MPAYAVVEYPNGSTSANLPVRSAEIDTSLDEMGQARAIVPRSDAQGANPDEWTDNLVIYDSRGVAQFGGPIRAVLSREEVVELLADTYERWSLDAPPAPATETYTATTDRAVVQDAVDAVPDLSRGQIQQVESGTFDIKFHHASQALKIRDMRDLSGAEMAYRPDKTVDYVSRLGTDKSGTTLSPSTQRVASMRVTKKASQRVATHLRVIGFNQSSDVVATNYTVGERQRWRRAYYPSVASTATLSTIGQNLVDDLYQPYTEIEVEIVEVTGINVGDTFTLDYPEEGINGQYRIVSLTQTYDRSGERYRAVFSDRTKSEDRTEVVSQETNELITRPVAESAPSTGGATAAYDSVPTIRLDSGQYVGVNYNVPSGYTYELLRAGIQTDANATDANLTIDLVNDTTASTAGSFSGKYNEGAPLASVVGPADVFVRLNNQTAAAQKVSGFWTFTMEGST